ncbi:MAG: ETC complex I subunit, partial [Caulobacteraceae bacterium]
MLARIYRPVKSAMQSGHAQAENWELRFAPRSARLPDPLMGWTTSTDTDGQIRLAFDTREQAIAYARKHAIAFEVIEEARAPVTPKAY